MPKVIIAIDSFKGCLSSIEANKAAAKAFNNAVCLPISDGGEGMTEAFKAMGFEYEEVTTKVHGPLMEEIYAKYLILKGYSGTFSDKKENDLTAVMEMAAACGLPLVPMSKRNPEKTTTYGFGEMLIDAISRGCKHIIIGIGGSATCDAGKGMLEAIEKLSDRSLLSYQEGNTQKISIDVACDVDNPLYGPNGAAYVFAPQKGADKEMVKRLDSFLKDLYESSGCKDSVPGDGAAGGLGFALRYFLGATLKPGIDVVLDTLGFDKYLEEAELIITGEGKCDRQTLMGKVPYGILQRAKSKGIPVVLIAGKVEDKESLIEAGFNDVICINESEERPLEILMQASVAKDNITKTSYNIKTTLKLNI